MTYSNVPLTGQTLGQTRDSINANFSLIQTTESVNHYAIGTANAGKHKFCSFPVQSADPGILILSGELGFYSKTSTNPAEPALYVQGQSTAGPTAGFVYQLTKSYAAKTAQFGVNAAYLNTGGSAGYTLTGGWTFLPGNMLLQYGVVTGSLNGKTNQNINFPIPFTVGYNITCTIYYASGTPMANNTVFTLAFANPVGTTQFNFTSVGSDNKVLGFYWTAIGQ